MKLGYDDLAAAFSPEDDRAVIRIRTTYQPSGGSGARIFPPTYPTSQSDSSPYILETRFKEGTEAAAVLLDSVPSQANRAEEALLRASRTGRIRIPMLELRHDGTVPVALSSLEMPHRFADAYLLDSLVDGVPFDKTPIGQSFAAANLDDALAIYAHDPGSLVYGAWNSHRKGRQAKFPRVYNSEVFGWDPQVGRRKAGRMDPLNLTGLGTRNAEGDLVYTAVGEKAKGARLSEIGHGNIAPNSAHGGVTVSSAERFATVSIAGLDRIGFGSAPEEAARAARVALAAYALLGDRLVFGGPSLWLRSGCELVAARETVEWVLRGSEVEPIELSNEDAVAIFAEAVERSSLSGLAMNLDPVIVTPGKGLKAAIEFALTKAEGSGD